MNDRLVAWVGLSLCQGIGGVRLRRLLDQFGDAPSILSASAKSLQTVKGITQNIIENIQSINLNLLAIQIQKWQSAGIHILTWDMPAYPSHFLTLPDAPPTIFVLGNLSVWKKASLYAIVGTRTPHPQKRDQTIRLSMDMAEKGHVVVSGLAEGIDVAAHLGTFPKPNGRTIGILGSGILNVYPRHHKALAEAILQRDGALICEVAPDSPASAWGLIGRNRLTVAISQALIVMQTNINGGAMHAVRFARLQNKPIYADDNPASGNQAILDEGGHDLAMLVL